MLLQRWEAKIRWKESLPQPQIKITTPGHESDTPTTEPSGRGEMFADNNLNSTEILKLVLENVQNIVGQGENAGSFSH